MDDDASRVPAVLKWCVGFAVRACYVGTAFAALALSALWYFQEKMLFHPEIAGRGLKRPEDNPDPFKSPEQYGMSYKNIYVTTSDDVKIHMWWIPHTTPSKARTFLFFQGNAGNMGFRLPNFRDMKGHLGVNILAVSYRGYGYSEGTPSEIGLIRDAEAALKWFHTESGADRKRLYTFGRSLGGALAINAATSHPHLVRGVIVENTFTSLTDMATVVFKFLRHLRYLITLLQRLHFDTLALMPKLKQPILFISGDADTLVPPAQVKLLYDSCKSSAKTLYVVKNGTHNDTCVVGGEEYYKAIEKFLEAAEKHEPLPQPDIPTKRLSASLEPDTCPRNTGLVPDDSIVHAEIKKER